MAVSFDPKVGAKAGVIGGAAATPAAPAVKRPLVTPVAVDKPRTLAEPTAAATHPSRAFQAGSTGLDKRVAKLNDELRGPKAGREAAAHAAVALGMGYAMRRSRGARHLGLSLCEDLRGSDTELAPLARALASLLAAEGQLHELDPGATMSACRTLVTLIEEESGDRGSAEARRVAALTRAVLAHALVQLVVHFPTLLAELGATVEGALRQALSLAEEAIALDPELPDGHAALARVLLCSDDPEAKGDAARLAATALAKDPEHDPALAAQASLALTEGRADEALRLADKLVKRGNALPHSVLLHALALAEAGRLDEARRELGRALERAPRAGVLWADAARLAARAGDAAMAAELEGKARALLAGAYDDVAAALVG